MEPASDGQALQAGEGLVVPPNGDATIELECVKLAAPAPRFGPSPSIDLLLDSLASDCGERAVAVVLSCRNRLIYFTAALQERVIDLFSFSLHPGGLLLLGSSESLGQLSGFRVLDTVHRLYERTQQVPSKIRLASLLGQPKTSQNRPALAVSAERESLPAQHIQLLDALIRVFAKPCLVLDENHTLVEVIGDVSSLPLQRIFGL